MTLTNNGIPIHTLQLPDVREADAAWAAGFIDGEGCITILKHRPSGQGRSTVYQATLRVVNTDRDALERLMEIFAVGSIHTQKRAKLNQKACFSWVVSGGNTFLRVIDCVYPYLVIKKRDADILYRFLALPRSGYAQGGVPLKLLEQREQLYREIRQGRPYRGGNTGRPCQEDTVSITMPDHLRGRRTTHAEHRVYASPDTIQRAIHMKETPVYNREAIDRLLDVQYIQSRFRELNPP